MYFVCLCEVGFSLGKKLVVSEKWVGNRIWYDINEEKWKGSLMRREVIQGNPRQYPWYMEKPFLLGCWILKEREPERIQVNSWTCIVMIQETHPEFKVIIFVNEAHNFLVKQNTKSHFNLTKMWEIMVIFKRMRLH